jgi:adenylylsulfate reductase, subunit A
MTGLVEPDVVQEDIDILIIGGGMAACGAGYEIVPWLAAARAQGVEISVKLVDKAALARSGAAAQGLSAIETYIGGDKDPADYARMVSNDLMGITRDDLTYDLARHVDGSVHLFEEWGLPVWKTDEHDQRQDGAKGLPRLVDGGRPVRCGTWQIMVNGESCKELVAEAARQGLGSDRVQEHVFIARLLNDRNDPNRIAGAAGFSVRDNRVYVYRAKAVLLAAGGCAGIFRPRSVGEGRGLTGAPGWSAGSTYAMAAEAGAELTMMENRCVPVGFKDGQGPVTPWLQLFKARVTNAYGDAFMEGGRESLNDYAPYGQASVTPTCLRNHLVLREMREGRGPIWIDTISALANLRDTLSPREVRRLEAEAWEVFLDQGLAQAGLWAAGNVEPEKTNSELMPVEPCLTGAQGGGCGIWTSGPTDVGAPTTEEHPDQGRIPSHLPAGWHWGYRGMTTVRGLFTAGDGVGASGHKSAAGAHAEGRLAAKAMVRYVMDNPDLVPEPDIDVDALVEELYLPTRTFHAHRDQTTAVDINPGYLAPAMLQLRLQKIMDEYVAGISTFYVTNEPMLAVAEQKLEILKKDAQQLCARDLHELLRAWENRHRIVAAEAHMRHLRFREETRYPGFYYRMDRNFVDDENWKCFVNSVYDRETGTWLCFKRAHKDLVRKAV